MKKCDIRRRVAPMIGSKCTCIGQPRGLLCNSAAFKRVASAAAQPATSTSCCQPPPSPVSAHKNYIFATPPSATFTMLLLAPDQKGRRGQPMLQRGGVALLLQTGVRGTMVGVQAPMRLGRKKSKKKREIQGGREMEGGETRVSGG